VSSSGHTIPFGMVSMNQCFIVTRKKAGSRSVVRGRPLQAFGRLQLSAAAFAHPDASGRQGLVRLGTFCLLNMLSKHEVPAAEP
jgi:hypothetical protein